MRLKVLACEVFTREVCLCVSRSPNVVDLEFTPKGAHDDSNYFRKFLQEKIDAVEAADREYAAIAIVLGLCGNSVAGLTARSVPLVLPRAHDCCTVFLGSREKFREHFQCRPSTPFRSVGYIEHGDSFVAEAQGVRRRLGLNTEYQELVRKFGEEDARYVWETLHPPAEQAGGEKLVFYIEVPEFSHLGYAAKCRAEAEKNSRQFIQLDGSLALFEKLINGDWSAQEFLIVQPGQSIAPCHDWDQIMKARPADKNAS